MSFWSSRRANDAPGGSLGLRSESSRSRRCRGQDSGFTLIELLIVVTIMPLIVGALGAGLLAVFSLQSGVANRLSNTTDAQVVSANFTNDVGSAAFITTESASKPQCGTGTQLLGLEWNYDATNNLYETRVSYVSVQVGSGPTSTWSLQRLYCTNESSGPSSTTTISYNLPSGQLAPTVTCNSIDNPCNPGGAWISASGVTGVTFPITELKGTSGQSSANTYQYTLEAVPQASSGTVPQMGSPINGATTTGCGFAAPGSGTYASNLCLVDFSSLTGNNLLAAEQNQNGSSSCLEMTATLPGNYQLYFCVKISGAPVVPSALPTWSQAFLGNSNSNGVPFYINIPGQPALYQTCEGNKVMTTLVAGTNIENCYSGTGGTPFAAGNGVTTITFSNIVVNNPQGIPATGWEVVSVDAESSDNGESLQWTSDQTLTVLPNSPTSQYGNACGGGLTGSGTTTVTCTGQSTSGNKTGTAMVVAPTPSTLTIQLTGAGLEGISFGLVL
jgi:prepilin-type N-terminal cleavage/methylation domain-containing protein